MRKISYKALMSAGLLCSGMLHAGQKDDADLLNALNKAMLENEGLDFQKDVKILLGLMEERYPSAKDYLHFQKAKYNYIKGSDKKATELFKSYPKTAENYSEVVESFLALSKDHKHAEGRFEALKIFFEITPLIADRNSEAYSIAEARMAEYRSVATQLSRPKEEIAKIEKMMGDWGVAKSPAVAYFELAAFVDEQEAIALNEPHVKGKKINRDEILRKLKYIDEQEWKQQDIYFYYMVSEYGRMLTALSTVKEPQPKPKVAPVAKGKKAKKVKKAPKPKKIDRLAEAKKYLNKWERKISEVDSRIKEKDPEGYQAYSPMANFRYAKGMTELMTAYKGHQKGDKAEVKKHLVGNKKKRTEWGAIYHFFALQKKYVDNDSTLRGLIRLNQSFGYLKTWLGIEPKKAPKIDFLAVARAEDIRGNSSAALEAYQKCLDGGAGITKEQGAEAAFRLVRISLKQKNIVKAEEYLAILQAKYASVTAPQNFLANAIQSLGYNYNKLMKEAQVAKDSASVKAYKEKAMYYQGLMSDVGGSKADSALALLMNDHVRGLTRAKSPEAKEAAYKKCLASYTKFKTRFANSPYYLSAMYQMAEASRIVGRNIEAYDLYKLFLEKEEGATFAARIKRARSMRNIADVQLKLRRLSGEDSLSKTIEQLSAYLRRADMKPVNGEDKKSIADLLESIDLYGVLSSEALFNDFYKVSGKDQSKSRELKALAQKVSGQCEVWLAKYKGSRTVPLVLAKQAAIYEKVGGTSTKLAAKIYQDLYTNHKDSAVTRAVMIKLIDDKMQTNKVAEAVKIGREIAPNVGDVKAVTVGTLRTLLDYYLLPTVPSSKVMSTSDFQHCSKFAAEIAGELCKRKAKSSRGTRHYYLFNYGKALIFSGQLDKGRAELAKIVKESSNSSYAIDINMLEAEALRSSDRQAAIHKLRVSLGKLNNMKEANNEKILQAQVLLAEIYNDSSQHSDVKKALQSAFLAKDTVVKNPTKSTIRLREKAEALWIINVCRLGLDKNPAFKDQLKEAVVAFVNNPNYALSPYLDDVQNPPKQQFD